MKAKTSEQYFLCRSLAHQQPVQEYKTEEGNGSADISPALQPYIEAIKIGSQAENFNQATGQYVYTNGTKSSQGASNRYENACHATYPDCPATSDELIEYIDRINQLDY